MISYVVDLEAITFKPTYDAWAKDQPENVPLSFPPPFTWEVVCLGYAKLDNGYLSKLGAGCVKESEKEGLQLFTNAVSNNTAQIISWNGRGYDLPVISYRCMYYGIPMTWYHADRSGYKYRYAGDKHFDVKDYLSEYGQHKISMDHAAKLIGLPGKMDTKGSDVAKMHAEGNIKDITAYCITDVLQTLLVFWRVEFIRGSITKEDYIHLIRDSHQKLTAEGQLDLKDEKHTILGNNIEDPTTLAIAKGCRKLTNNWDLERMVSI